MEDIMFRYIYGFDRSDPKKSAKEFRLKGITAVVSDASAAPLANVFADEGIDLYLCFGAYGLGNHNQYRRCRDVSGEERVWFSSGCPNDRKLSEANLQAVLDACTPGIKGIFVDGARFASFASAEGSDAFFTCFCHECMERMSDMGMEPEKIRTSVSNLKQKHIFPEDISGISDWLRFRSACVKAYMDDFSSLVHSLGNIKAGAFIFEPMLAPFVGQTSEACASLDIIAPMLYRNYPHKNGPACMGHEWSGFLRMFGEAASGFMDAAGIEYPLPAGSDGKNLLSDGFAPEDVGKRIAASRSALKPGQSLWPIIQIEDDRLFETEKAAYQNGADAVGYFMYGMAELP